MQFSTAFASLLAAVSTVTAVPWRNAPYTGAHSLAPSAVTGLTCDGKAYKCTATLNFGDGNWIATWSAYVYHATPVDMSSLVLGPVAVESVGCDAETKDCTAHLKFGDGRWYATWPSAITQPTPGARGRPAYSKTTGLSDLENFNCDGHEYKCTADLKFDDGPWVAEWIAAVYHMSNDFLDQN